MFNKKQILLGHGSGGRLSHELITQIFIRHFDNSELNKQGDSAILTFAEEKLAFTTDSFVVDPLFFSGGDIGKLAVAGTVNDLAVAGAEPRYLSASFIIEEGLPFNTLEKIVISMAEEAKAAGVKIVTGDTKVVDRGKCDKLFINTSGIGTLISGAEGIAEGMKLKAGDKIIINGHIGDHGMAVMSARNQLQIHADLQTDCASLNHMIKKILETIPDIHFMRDATRGGLATVLAEIADKDNVGIELDESNIPVRDSVKGMCELLGFDPLYVANEGKVVMVVGAESAEAVINSLQEFKLGKNSAVIGEIVADHPGRVWLHTQIGGTRIVDMLAGEQLPRIC